MAEAAFLLAYSGSEPSRWRSAHAQSKLQEVSKTHQQVHEIKISPLTPLSSQCR